MHVGGSYLLIADGKLEAAAERQLPSENFEGIYFDDDEEMCIRDRWQGLRSGSRNV